MRTLPDSATPLWFPFVFVALWLVITYLQAKKSDWQLLASRYPGSGRPDGATLKGQVYSVGTVGEAGITVLTVSPQGLHLSANPFFRMGRPPILLPWQSIQGIQSGRSWGKDWYSLNVDGVTLIRVGSPAYAAMKPYLRIPAPP